MINARELRNEVKSKEELETRFVNNLLNDLEKNMKHLADNGLFQFPESIALNTSETVFTRITGLLEDNGFHTKFAKDDTYEGKEDQNRYFLMVGWAEEGLIQEKEEEDEE